ncbi:hypothetical protein VBM89_01295 [Mycoplasma sp. 1199]|uniref:DUF3137 domain-containing protein n=1 Tax=Mycoplasma sp. 1199 TaxID=3108526 RepID=UPI002B1E26F6|nr:DUF3137 domain-containing protein [Mycoplasma sp. 1199]MEA4206144.1 hypothetical protein [Mycoplasma sp. 1199]
MKRAEDFISIDKFYEKANQTVLPIVKNRVNEITQLPIYVTYKRTNRYALRVFLASIGAFLFSGFFLGLETTKEYGGFRTLSVFTTFAIIFGLVFVISILVAIGFWIKAWNINRKIKKEIISQLHKSNIYGVAIEALIDRWKYEGTNFTPTSIKHNFDPNTNKFTKDEYLSTRPKWIPNGSQLRGVTEIQTVTIDNKYHAHISEAHWVDFHTDKDGNTHEEHYYSALIKIDARALAQKDQANFTFFGDKFSDLEPVELENIEFNKIYKVKSNNPTKMFQLFTPLAMEEMNKLFQFGIKNTSIMAKGMRYWANNDVIHASFQCSSGFMAINSSRFIGNKEKLINTIYKDVIKDIYSLYFILALSYIPVYLY